MRKNRYLLCLLACGFMLYMAVPKLVFTGDGLEKLFSYAWLLLAFLVAAGNLSGLLYYPRQPKNNKNSLSDKKRKRQQSFMD